MHSHAQLSQDTKVTSPMHAPGLFVVHCASSRPQQSPTIVFRGGNLKQSHLFPFVVLGLLDLFVGQIPLFPEGAGSRDCAAGQGAHCTKKEPCTPCDLAAVEVSYGVQFVRSLRDKHFDCAMQGVFSYQTGLGCLDPL